MVISNVDQVIAGLGLANEYLSHYTAVCVDSNLNGYTEGEEYTVVCGAEVITEAQAKFSDKAAGELSHWVGVLSYSEAEGNFITFNGGRGFIVK